MQSNCKNVHIILYFCASQKKYFEKFSKTLDKEYKAWYTCKVFCFTPKKYGLEGRASIMFEKNLNIGYLLDFYGDLLSERKRSVMDLYYNEDLSLAEIAAEIGISRQGVHDLIKKSEEELQTYEEKLRLAARLRSVEQCVEELSRIAEAHPLPSDLRAAIEALTAAVRQNEIDR